MTPMVVVSRAEQQMIWQSCSMAVLTKVSGDTSVPRSMTSRPLPSIIIFTRFLPMSWRSPWTVPMHTLPEALTPASASRGFKSWAPMFMARAATSTSGTKTSLFLNFSPTTFMPLKSPSSRICSTGMPWSMACWTSSFTTLALPFCRFSEISVKMLMFLLLLGENMGRSTSLLCHYKPGRTGVSRNRLINLVLFCPLSPLTGRPGPG